ncbi:DUF421 domain-containing protein [Pedobacter insulae]|uniref:Uncharacterized membrane protein YcaP, DUF421 family n=1 Tax=Pedobacter insulae TaxID=414048 RepID=A0A1I3AIR4_9SPHI|nr:YetF domain-containing protein [Pedobacter insulae]SFH49964.1 Uncharacterized membrane protein YcaP, DUF421 family [Pedobacter insulae]
MTILLAVKIFQDLEKLLIGDQEWVFIPEIMFRTLIMYLIVLFSLRILGKRGVKQLSVFELVVIIGLGSAAGDPMFYKEVGLISAISVFIIVIIAYKITAFLVNKSSKVEELLEGSCTCLIENGKFSIENFKKESLARDEFFSELRLNSVSHLGQIHLAIIETSGSISLFYYPKEEVKYGLPILPELFKQQFTEIKRKDHFSCAFCGYTQLIPAVAEHTCKICERTKWVKAMNIPRIT